ncbi:serpin-Z2B-like [Rhododendron vialii]|uniref:serpin-Z2B-like n=1 Tax=Rhododendron vialii TaxID=182163 RepID=UPI00265D9972|nr:serpin-Z2B-like [Rhododendron vialii]
MMAVAACRDDEGGDGPVLCMVNGVWVDERFTLVDSYKEEILKGVYGCDAESADFYNQVEEVVKKVNSWGEDASKGLIKNLLQPRSLRRYLKTQQSSLQMDYTSKEFGLINVDLTRVSPKKGISISSLVTPSRFHS